MMRAASLLTLLLIGCDATTNSRPTSEDAAEAATDAAVGVDAPLPAEAAVVDVAVGDANTEVAGDAEDVAADSSVTSDVAGYEEPPTCTPPSTTNAIVINGASYAVKRAYGFCSGGTEWRIRGEVYVGVWDAVEVTLPEKPAASRDYAIGEAKVVLRYFLEGPATFHALATSGCLVHVEVSGDSVTIVFGALTFDGWTAVSASGRFTTSSVSVDAGYVSEAEVDPTCK